MTIDKTPLLPETPSPVKSAHEEAPRRFVPDYRFASRDDIREATRHQLAKLEVELHTLRIIYYAKGENPDIPVTQNRTLGQEMLSVSNAIDRLYSYFEDIIEGTA